MECKYVETGRLTDEDVEDEVEEIVCGVYDEVGVGYLFDLLFGLFVVGDDVLVSGSWLRKMMKKQMKKERDALVKEQERMMKRV